jgi:kynureninase
MALADEADLLASRSEFPTLAKSVHLISHSLGAMPSGARAATTRFLDQWEDDSVSAWGEHWLPAVRSLGDVIAGVLGVAPGTVCVLPNVSIAQAAVASCFSFEGKRRRVVYDDLNFSTVHYVWQEQARRGAEVVVVHADDRVHPPIAKLLAAIDERTLIVPISHVLFRSSGMVDARRIIDHAHAVGALVLLDVYQSAATVPLRLAEWDCDLACGGSVKWACGGPGAAYLYARPDLANRLEPMVTGWFAHAEPFAFDMGPMRFAQGAWRMIGGTMAIPAVYAARTGWDTIARLGVERIRAKSLRQTRLLRDLVLARGFTVNTPVADEARGGTVCFDFPGAEGISRELVRRRFFHDYRPRCGLRVSPHFYTTDEELVAFVDALDEVRRNPPAATGAAAY